MIALKSVFISVILSSSVYTAFTQGNTITVNSKSGPITGVGVIVENETVYQFRKIPYAKPPLGNLRFKKPLPYGTWNQTLDATEFGPSCIQTIDSFSKNILPNTNIDEDCLFLNIYVPRNVSMYNFLTVMVWIHGGSFISGQGMLYDGSFLALSGNVVVVTINYRLNIFGFLSTGDSASPGNYGLWDQRMAIEWVRSNIFAFGGFPYSITIFGESAGSLSIGLQTIYPGNMYLFQRAIMESGSGNSFVSYTNKGPYAAKIFGSILSCPTNNSIKLVSCLRNQSSDSLLRMQTKAVNISFDLNATHIGLVLGPAIDGEFVTDDPKKLLSDKTSESYKLFRSLDIMTGTMSAEGSLLLGTLKQYQTIFNFNVSKGVPTSMLCDHLVPSIVKDFYMGNQNISTAICNKYGVQNVNDTAEQGRQAVNMYGDMLFISPAVKTLQIHSQNNKNTSSYQFHFTHFNSLAFGGPFPAWFRGASHATELLYLFRILKASNITIPNEDMTLSDYMLKYWTNFAKTGHPNGNGLPEWPDFKQNSAYMDLNWNPIAKSKLYPDRMQFWLTDILNLEHVTPINYSTPIISPPTSKQPTSKMSTISSHMHTTSRTKTAHTKTSRKVTTATPGSTISSRSPTTITRRHMSTTMVHANTTHSNMASVSSASIFFISTLFSLVYSLS